MKTKEIREFIEELGKAQSISATTCERRGEWGDDKFLVETDVFLIKSDFSVFTIIVDSSENNHFVFEVDSVTCVSGEDSMFVEDINVEKRIDFKEKITTFLNRM